jgi:hypothetical protein
VNRCRRRLRSCLKSSERLFMWISRALTSLSTKSGADCPQLSLDRFSYTCRVMSYKLLNILGADKQNLISCHVNRLLHLYKNKSNVDFSMQRYRVYPFFTEPFGFTDPDHASLVPCCIIPIVFAIQFRQRK